MAGIIARDPLYYGRYGRALPTSSITSATVNGDTVNLLGLGASYASVWGCHSRAVALSAAI